MSPEAGHARGAGARPWTLLFPLLCALVLAGGSTPSPEDPQSAAATPLPESWTGTTIQLQPDLQTEAQTQEALTLTDAPTQSTTGNYTGESVRQSPLIPISVSSHDDFYLCAALWRARVESTLKEICHAAQLKSLDQILHLGHLMSH